VGFYIRKSISAGPFRFNLSKSGVGLSVGVRGLRIGTGPRGHYVHAGVGGLYYRSSLGGAGQRRSPTGSSPTHSPASPTLPNEFYHPTVQMVEVESADVMEMADSRFQTILEDLNQRSARMRLSWTMGVIGFFVWAIASFNVYLLLVPLIGFAVGAYVDSYRRACVVFYDLNGQAHEAYTSLVAAFETLRGCIGKWHVAAGGAIRDLDTWKRNAGAGHLVNKSPTKLDFALPPALKSNVTPPCIAAGKQVLFFMPDVVLVSQNGRYGAVAYDQLAVTFQYSRFIEDGAVPADARVVDYTWKYVNKKGGPDRRFSNNRQLPICLYEAMHLTSASGLNELFEFSVIDVAAPFAQAVAAIAAALKQRVVGPSNSQPEPKPETAATNGEPATPSNAQGKTEIKAVPQRAGSLALASTEATPPEPLWENTLTGMTIDEVRRVRTDAVDWPDAIKNEVTGAIAPLVIPSHKLFGQTYFIALYFLASRLSEVALCRSGVTRAEAEQVLNCLREKHGPEEADELVDASRIFAQWPLGQQNRVQLALSGDDLYIIYGPKAAEGPPPHEVFPAAVMRNKGSAGNQGGSPILWQNVRYGMTRSELQQVQPSVQPPPTRDSLNNGAIAELELPHFDVDGVDCAVQFYFLNGRLCQVMINRSGDVNVGTAYAFLELMRTKYGPEKSLSEPSSDSMIPMLHADWLLPNGVNVALVWGKGVLLNLAYQFHGSEALKL
jgi:uncharacterized protein DUF4236